MSKYYVDSFAYDYDMFMPHEKKQNNVVEINRKKSRPTAKKTASRMFTAGALVKTAFVLVMLALIMGNIYLRVQVTEITTEINKVQTEYSRALSQNTSLEMQLESTISYKNLEDSAKALGMQKAEPHQINYINSVDSDKVEITDGKTLVTAAK